MYPTGSPPANIERDIEYLTRSVEDAAHKPYLRTQLIESLASLGYDRGVAETAVERYFKVSLQ